jgi:hypothetical protein
MISNRWTWGIVGLVVLVLAGQGLKVTHGGRGLGAVLLWGGLGLVVVVAAVAVAVVWLARLWKDNLQPRRRYANRRARRLAGRAWLAFVAALPFLLFTVMATLGGGGHLSQASVYMLALVLALLVASALCHTLANRLEYPPVPAPVLEGTEPAAVPVRPFRMPDDSDLPELRAAAEEARSRAAVAWDSAWAAAKAAAGPVAVPVAGPVAEEEAPVVNVPAQPAQPAPVSPVAAPYVETTPYVPDNQRPVIEVP